MPRSLLVGAAAGLVLVAAALLLPPQLHGDAGEYLLMLESWHEHLSPELRPADLDALRAHLRAAGVRLDESRILPNYHAGRDGKLYCYHFWAYPLAGLPARAALPLFGVDPLKALPLTNALFFALALTAVGGVPWRGSRRAFLGALLAFSPALAFLLWPHPEVVTFALVATALALSAQDRAVAAILAAALGSLQNPPVALLVGLLWVRALVVGARPAAPVRAPAFLQSRRVAVALGATLTALAALLPAAFFLWQFGVFNLSVRPSEAQESLSWIRAADLFVDPNLGLLPHAPLTLLLAVLGAAAALRARRAWPAPALVALLPLLAFACTANGNWNNDTSGPSRYVAWMLPLVAFAAVAETGGPASAGLRRGAASALALAVLTQGAAVLARGGPLARSDFLEHSPAARLLLDRWPAVYRPAPEVFVERTLHTEGPFEGPVVYRDPSGRCRKAYLQWRHAAALVAKCGAPPGEMAARLEANARLRDVKREWTYVDY